MEAANAGQAVDRSTQTTSVGPKTVLNVDHNHRRPARLPRQMKRSGLLASDCDPQPTSYLLSFPLTSFRLTLGSPGLSR